MRLYFLLAYTLAVLTFNVSPLFYKLGNAFIINFF